MSTTPSARRPAIAFNHPPASSSPAVAGSYEKGNSKLRGNSVEFLMKRGIDFVGAGVGLIIISPLMLILAAIIRLDSKGPIFFRQVRMGRDGRTFEVWKFRTMVQDAESRMKDVEHLNESQGGVLFKMKSDPRITRSGVILRRTSLDELPQLFNVVCGQMSLIGPRPLPLRDCALLQEMDDTAFARRHEVLPGLTGLWQVSGRSLVGVRQMIDLDCHYIDNWSLRLDLWILVKTLGILLARKGAF